MATKKTAQKAIVNTDRLGGTSDDYYIYWFVKYLR